MKLTGFKWLAAGLMLSAIGAAASAYHSGAAPAAGGSAIEWKTTPVSLAAVDTVPTSQNFARSLSVAFRSASAKVLPSVVTIQSMAPEVSINGMQPNGNLPEELRDHPFFKRFFDGMPEGAPQVPNGRQRSGMGSGVIVDASGIILTNNHVVEGAERLTVKLHDGREFQAVEWKTDPGSDIAVVRISSATSLPAASIGNSDNLDVGDWVMAVGAPFGLDETVTAGIISAKSRGIGMASRQDFLQTDAAINPGNSGGPLINLDGEVVGINTAISSTSGGHQGVGFAIPINVARWVSDQLMTHGVVQRAFLGVGIQPVDNDLSKKFGLTAVRGAVVTEVREGSPAAEAGLQSGDVILEFDGMPISKPGDLQALVERASLTENHSLAVVRDGKPMTLSVRVEVIAPEMLASGRVNAEPKSESEFGKLGLQLTELTPEVASRLGMDNVKGLVITAVGDGSPAQKAGLQDGMVILKVGQQNVRTLDDFRDALSKTSLSDGILMLVQSGDATRFVVVGG